MGFCLPFFLYHSGTLLRSPGVVSQSYGVVAATGVGPFRFNSRVTGLFLCKDGNYLRVVQILLARNVRVGPVRGFRWLQVLRGYFLPLCSYYARTTSQYAEIVGLVSLLNEAFQVSPRSRTFSYLFHRSSGTGGLKQEVGCGVVNVLGGFLRFVHPMAYARCVGFFS